MVPGPDFTPADDAIVLKSIRRADQAANPTGNVTTADCLLSSYSSPLMIGTETETDIRPFNGFAPDFSFTGRFTNSIMVKEALLCMKPNCRARTRL